VQGTSLKPGTLDRGGISRGSYGGKIDKILKYIAQFPDVWFASHGEIARWTLDESNEAATHARRVLAA
jgi:hypothetical protein